MFQLFSQRILVRCLLYLFVVAASFKSSGGSRVLREPREPHTRTHARTHMLRLCVQEDPRLFWLVLGATYTMSRMAGMNVCMYVCVCDVLQVWRCPHYLPTDLPTYLCHTHQPPAARWCTQNAEPRWMDSEPQHRPTDRPTRVPTDLLEYRPTYLRAPIN